MDDAQSDGEAAMESSTDEIPIVMDVQPEGEAAMEPIAVIGPEEAAEVSGQRWASGIELLVSGAASTAVDASSIDIVVLQFSRDQRAFDEVLWRGDLESSGGIWGNLE